MPARRDPAQKTGRNRLLMKISLEMELTVAYK